MMGSIRQASHQRTTIYHNEAPIHEVRVNICIRTAFFCKPRNTIGKINICLFKATLSTVYEELFEWL